MRAITQLKANIEANLAISSSRLEVGRENRVQ